MPFPCPCGEVKGTLHGASPRAGNHMPCYCASCPAAILYANGEDVGWGGSARYQTTPDKISFQQGRGNLGIFSLRPKSCCAFARYMALEANIIL